MVHRGPDRSPGIERRHGGIRTEGDAHPRGMEIGNRIEKARSFDSQSRCIHALATAPALIEYRLHAGDDSESGALANTLGCQRLGMLDAMPPLLHCLHAMLLCGLGKGPDDSLGRRITDRMESGLLPALTQAST